MMDSGYWRRQSSRLVGRRRFLQAGAVLSAGAAAFLAACGGSNSNGTKSLATATKAPTSGAGGAGTPAAAVSTPARAGTPAGGTPSAGGATSSAPVVSGDLAGIPKDFLAGGPYTGSPQKGGHYATHFSSSTNFNVIANWYEGTYLSGVHVYDRLISSRADARRYALEAAQSVQQPDPLTVIFKLTPNMVYQNLPPVNGRALKPDDIIQTQQAGTQASNAYDNAFQKDFLDSVQAPDATTVIYKLKKPNAYLFSST